MVYGWESRPILRLFQNCIIMGWGWPLGFVWHVNQCNLSWPSRIYMVWVGINTNFKIISKLYNKGVGDDPMGNSPHLSDMYFNAPYPDHQDKCSLWVGISTNFKIFKIISNLYNGGGVDSWGTCLTYKSMYLILTIKNIYRYGCGCRPGQFRDNSLTV